MIHPVNFLYEFSIFDQIDETNEIDHIDQINETDQIDHIPVVVGIDRNGRPESIATKCPWSHIP
ncbi:MAG: hypothetical protein ACE5K2_09630 [Candidatus Zixiibacteriota bacterium]